MITGRVLNSSEAVLVLGTHSNDASRIEIEFIIDTGFNDHLTLPSGLVTALELQHQYTNAAVLGDGRIVRVDAYQAVVDWDGNERPVPVYELEIGPSLGMAMLKEHRLSTDVVDDGLLTIEPVP